MASSIKIRTSIKDGLTTVRSILRHPMHTGYEKDPETGNTIPAHYIEKVIVHHGNKLILQCDWSRAVSSNPYLSFIFSGAKAGDTLRISWSDNKRESDTAEAIIQ
ncbi:MAG: thiosulfate oxidation carrier complex protein SoxZ [Gammaproteobacteria bacterium]|nr:thiosulfate oxidation carrier complex protein SoxZ [Gammaproteobacteria bacterium]